MARPDAEDVMTRGVIDVSRDTSVKEAAALMRQHGIRGLVVVDADEIVGIVAGKDMLYKVVAEGKQPESIAVEDVMTRDVVTVSAYDNVREVSQTMLKYDISRVPVMRGDEIVGIITQTNLIRAWPGYVDVLEERGVTDYSDM